MSAMRSSEFGVRNGMLFRIPHSAFRISLLLVACCLSLVTGCAALPLPFPLFQQEHASSQQTSILDDGYTDYAGVIHIHTTYSHDAHGTFADVIRVANAQRLDYVVITEHNNLRALHEGKQGRSEERRVGKGCRSRGA